MVLAISARQRHFYWQVSYSHLQNIFMLQCPPLQSNLSLVFAAIVYWTGRYSSPSSLPIDLRYASNCNIRLRIPQTEIYSLKIKASKKRCRCFHSHTSKIGLSEIHFQDL